MCDSCGCGITDSHNHSDELSGKTTVEVLENLLSENDHQAAHNRQHFNNHGVLAVNLMSSPGSGKTRLLESTIDALKNDYRIGVIEGDLETENDAQRIRDKGVPAVQITTGTACHLDAHMVHQALHRMALEPLDILFIENVGNLVCPASFDLGQHLNVTLLSVTEGDDKPIKYPVIFRVADKVLITKADLLPLLDDFNCSHAAHAVSALAVQEPVGVLSAKSGEGMKEWLDWLKRTHREQVTHQAQSKTESTGTLNEVEHSHAHG